MSRVKTKETGTITYKGVKIELSSREGRFGRIDYGYRLPSGAWGAGLGTRRGAIEAAKQAIRERKK